MIRRGNLYVIAMLSLGGSAVALPDLASAKAAGSSAKGAGSSAKGAGSSAKGAGSSAKAVGSSGGASFVSRGTAPSSSAGGSKGGFSDQVHSGNSTISASGSGIRLVTHSSAMLGNKMRFTGSVSLFDGGKIVEIERQGHQTGGAWQPTAHGVAAANGSFTAVWQVSHIGRFRLRAVVENAPGVRPRRATMSPALTATVYRPSLATQYGPGFYGQRTACGQTLRGHTIGVANRTLPCGTSVSVYYRGRTLVVPVIDRGPYANGADWDLTEAAGRALGIVGTARIGAVSLPGR